MRRLLALALALPTGCISAVAPRTGEIVPSGDLAFGYSVASLSWSPATFTSSKGERSRYNAGPVSRALWLLGGLLGLLLKLHLLEHFERPVQLFLQSVFLVFELGQ